MEKDTISNELIKRNSAVSIVITSFNDRRILHLLSELKSEEFHEIIIADGGSEESLIREIKNRTGNGIKLCILPGKVSETRSKVQKIVEGDIVVFIDTDETPSEGWLSLLIEPIIKNRADFVFGPTKPVKISKNRITRYVDSYDTWFYDNILPHDISKGAMGNSAWRREILEKISFDPKLTMGGEDYDFTLNALKNGYKGCYVKDAFLYHDQSSVDTLVKFVRKKFNYLVGASIAYRKNESLFSKIKGSAEGGKKFDDPLEMLVLLMKPVALVVSLVKYATMRIEKN